MEKYTAAEKEKIRLLIKRTFNRAMERGWTYRQIAPLLHAECSTVWRWFHYKSWPSQRHIFQIKKFLGYIGQVK